MAETLFRVTKEKSMTEKKKNDQKPEGCTNDETSEDMKNSRWYSKIGEKGDRELAEMLNDMMDKGRIKDTE